MGGVVVIGSANADMLVRVARRPAGGETLLGSDLEISAGGKGANQAVAAARVGAEVRFVGCVGADGHGTMLRESLVAAGVGVACLHTVETATGCALIFLTPDGENSIVVAPAANSAVTADFARNTQPDWATACIVVMQLEVPIATVAYVAGQCAELGIRFLLNAAPAATVSADILSVCDPLVVNESEAALLLGADTRGPEPQDLAAALLDMGARSVVITLGAAGSFAMDRTRAAIRQHAPRVAVVDTTGAGDAFVGALAAALAEGQSLAAGVEAGTQVAAIAVQHPGAQPSSATTSKKRPH